METTKQRCPNCGSGVFYVHVYYGISPSDIIFLFICHECGWDYGFSELIDAETTNAYTL